MLLLWILLEFNIIVHVFQNFFVSFGFYSVVSHILCYLSSQHFIMQCVSVSGIQFSSICVTQHFQCCIIQQDFPTFLGLIYLKIYHFIHNIFLCSFNVLIYFLPYFKVLFIIFCCCRLLSALNSDIYFHIVFLQPVFYYVPPSGSGRSVITGCSVLPSALLITLLFFGSFYFEMQNAHGCIDDSEVTK